MPKQINELTEAQKARFGEWRDKWIEIGLNTSPITPEEKERFTAAVARCYKAADFEPPSQVLWVSSPFVLAHEAPTLAWKLDNPGKRDPAALAAYVKDNWHRYIGGQFWVGGWYWGAPAVVSFFREVCDLELEKDIAERALAYETTARTACWWWPHREFVMVSERPTRIRRDDQGRLHSETGKAIEWPDGWGVSSWHGTVVPHEWIAERNKLDPSLALTHPQVEQRRAAAEIIGWDKVLSQLNPKVIDKHADPMTGELLSVDLPDAPDSRFLRVLCATGRIFVLPVPQEMNSALNAQTWLWSELTAKELKELEVRT